MTVLKDAPPALSVSNSDATARHTADIRIRADQLRWMIEAHRWDEADRTIGLIRGSLQHLSRNIDMQRMTARRG